MSTVDGVKGVMVCLESEEDRSVIFPLEEEMPVTSPGSFSWPSQWGQRLSVPSSAVRQGRWVQESSSMCVCSFVSASDCVSMFVKVKLQDDFVVNVGLRSMLSRATHLNFQIWPCFLTYLNAERSVKVILTVSCFYRQWMWKNLFICFHMDHTKCVLYPMERIITNVMTL